MNSHITSALDIWALLRETNKEVALRVNGAPLLFAFRYGVKITYGLNDFAAICTVAEYECKQRIFYQTALIKFINIWAPSARVAPPCGSNRLLSLPFMISAQYSASTDGFA